MTYYVQSYPYRRMARRWMSQPVGQDGRSLPVDVRNEEEAFVLTALVPGLKSDDLNIQVLEDVVSIEGEYPNLVSQENDYLLSELPGGQFRRTLRLPVPVEAEQVEAKITNGVLTLRLPKAESARPRKIAVSAK
jgi:HSP20 family protein